MQIDVLLIVLLYEIVTIIGVGWIIAKQSKGSKEKDSFMLAEV